MLYNYNRRVLGYNMKIHKRFITIGTNNIKTRIYDSRDKESKVPGVLWIHGGGYIKGSSKLLFISMGRRIAKNFESVIFSPNYRLAPKNPYPAALEDCYETLEYMYNHADELGIDKNKIVVGGESAGGGLCLAVCIMARDKGKIKINYQFPLYPMIDCEDTESSKDNHGYVWDTKKNHKGWKAYLGDLYGSDNIPAYASPAKLNKFDNLPPLYTFVGDGEPFYKETLDFVEKAKKAKIKAEVDVYHTKVHSFDMALPFSKNAKIATNKILDVYRKNIIKK